jgi:hypothetical protein
MGDGEQLGSTARSHAFPCRSFRAREPAGVFELRRIDDDVSIARLRKAADHPMKETATTGGEVMCRTFRATSHRRTAPCRRSHRRARSARNSAGRVQAGACRRSAGARGRAATTGRLLPDSSNGTMRSFTAAFHLMRMTAMADKGTLVFTIECTPAKPRACCFQRRHPLPYRKPATSSA